MRHIRAFYRPGAFLTHAQWSEEEIRHGRPGSPRHNEFWYVWAVTLHEWFHHIQIIGSSFGHEYLLCALASGAGLCKQLKEVFRSDSMCSLARPLLAPLLEHCTSPDDLTQAIGLHAHLEILLGLRNEAELIFGNLKSPVESPCPVVRAKGHHVSLGAVHVMEAHARCNEALYLANYSGLASDSLKSIFEYLEDLSCDDYKVYYSPSDYVEEQTGVSGFVQKQVFCLICDVALNPPEPTSIQRDKGTLFWEDYHPGWRFVRATELVSSELHRFDISEDQGLKGIMDLLYREFSWPQDAFRRNLDDPMLRAFAERVCRVRASTPLAFALPIEHFPQLQKEFPVSFRHYRSVEDSGAMFDTVPWNAPTQFEAARQLGGIYEKTVHEVLLRPCVTCPWHGTRMPPATSCEEQCLFPSFFSTALGITLDQYCEIPLVKDVTEGYCSNR